MTALRKDLIREIKNSKNRFLSIAILIALAVAFLSGLKATAPDMKNTGDEYLDKQQLMDIQVLSTLGLTKDDIKALGVQDNIERAVGAYCIDAWAGDLVAKAYSITDGMNLLTVTSGRMPESPDECIVDKNLLEKMKISVGDSITIDPSDDYEDCLTHKNFTIVGTAVSPYYISVERGSASIGSGNVRAYVYLPEGAFDLDYYTVAYAKVKGAQELTAFTDEYDDYIDDVMDSLKDFGDRRAKLRYDDIIDEAQGKIDDAQKELDDKEKEADEKLSDAEQELKDARRKLDKGWREYRDGKKELEESLPKLCDAECELADARQELIEGEQEYQKGLDEYNFGYAQYAENKRKLDESYAKLSAAQQQLNAAKQIPDQIAKLDGTISALKTQRESLNPNDPEQAAQIAVIDAQITELSAQKAALVSASMSDAEIAAAQAEIDAGMAEYNAGKQELDAAKAQLDAAKKKLDEGYEELQDGKRKYREGVEELQDGWKKYYEGIDELPKAYKKLKDGEKEYADGLEEYEDAKREAEEKIADAKEKLADARRKVADIETCKWYILSRSYNPGYTGFGQDADRMANLASVFPVIFFLVAALVCLTTMTRMVEEQRTQIGLMKALGYGRWDISKKYLCYGLFPSLAGSLLGIIIGHIVFPTMIYVSYQIMYEMPNIRLSFYPGICIWATIAAVACTTLSTLWACISTLTDSPANLMRPKAPPAGKRVLLERITPVWHALSFNWKITVRNLFRYKKRFFMTVIGIGGCTGLIIAGFGLRDSLMMTMDTQYGDIFRYDAQITLNDGLLDTEHADIKAYLDSSDNISEYTEIYAGSVTAESPAYSTTAYVEVFDPEDIGKFVITRAISSGDEMTLPESGVIIDQKLSELLKVNVGDSITIDSDGRHSAKIAGIYQNYVAHFIYLTPAAYEDIFGDEAEINTVILNLEDNSNAACEATMEEMLKLHGVSAASRTADVKDTYMHSMERVDFVVVVVILCAAALAIVVLYNLSNINMTERIRELATIKVLGFYDIEVTTYLCRENIILTAAGIALGCVFGKYLHAWLIRSVEIDLMMFGRSTTAMSYAFSAALTVIFSAIVNVMAHVKMKGIDMIESLKSAE